MFSLTHHNFPDRYHTVLRFVFCDEFLFSSHFACSFYLTRVPRAASSQGMQDESGAKSGNWLAEFVYVVRLRFQFYFLGTSSRQAGFFAKLA